MQNIEDLRMHYNIKDSTGSVLLGIILIITDEEEFLRSEVCPNGVSSVSMWA
jgi:hypothetical protein